jgi:glycosyltransferase involved in cell wall biosynthesis
MRVALVYDRLNKIGGAEHVLETFHKIFPQADWYTSFWDPKTAVFSRDWKVTSFPYLHHHHELFPWLMPFIFESYNFSRYDLVISIGSAESKGVVTRPGTVHLNYCLTPTRYLYSHSQEYLSNPVYTFVARYLRKWDLVASTRPDEMIAISTQVKNRIKDIYKRDSAIIFPPVDTKKFAPSSRLKTQSSPVSADYFLVVSRLVPYKKIDILVHAANRSRKNLIVVGIGSEYQKLKKLAGPTVSLVGYISDADLPSYYQNCTAYLQANEEDFGISMCEAQSAGKPVIAYGQGGACDIVIPGKTGILLEKNTIEAFAKALSEFDTMSFVPTVCLQNAGRFDQNIWIKQIKERIASYGFN